MEDIQTSFKTAQDFSYGLALMNIPRKSLQFFYLWQYCIHSGLYVKLENIESELISTGFCRAKNKYVDFELECVGCEERKEVKTKTTPEKTTTKRKRISTGRQRSIARQKDFKRRNLSSKAINQYGDGTQGSPSDSNRDSDKSKKRKASK